MVFFQLNVVCQTSPEVPVRRVRVSRRNIELQAAEIEEGLCIPGGCFEGPKR